MEASVVLSQTGLVLGFVGSIVLAFSGKVGVIMKGGRIRFEGLDDMAPVEENIKIVKNSHWRHRYLTPVGWLLLASAFFLQFLAGLC